MIGRPRHLAEERLFDCYLAERTGDPLDLASAEHLADCDDCAGRYRDLTRFMDGLRHDAALETDEVFTPDRLHAQRQAVLQRIAHVGRAARVLAFPGRLVSRRMSPAAAHGAARWIYAAAAAGLVIGVGLGAVYESDWRALPYGRTAVVLHQGSSARARVSPIATAGTTPPPEAADDAFLSDLDVALERPHTRSLQPFDALTPHVREVSDRVR